MRHQFGCGTRLETLRGGAADIQKLISSPTLFEFAALHARIAQLCKAAREILNSQLLSRWPQRELTLAWIARTE